MLYHNFSYTATGIPLRLFDGWSVKQEAAGGVIQAVQRQIRTIARSLTLVPVGPVIKRPPIFCSA